MFRGLQPKAILTEQETESGLRALVFDGMCSQVMGALTGGALLVAFALALGASNTMIGLLAAAGPLTQILHIPAILLIDRLRRRKVLVVSSSILSRSFLLLVAVSPWLVPAEHRATVLLVSLLCYFALGTISGSAFNSWIRDLVPEKIMGRYFGKRMAIATALGAVVTLLAGFSIDFGKNNFENPVAIYGLLFLVGTGAGFLGVLFLSRVPEPVMTAPPSRGLWAMLSEPFREKTFRQLLFFLGSWSFAVNLAAPFFTVYMLSRLGLNLSFVMGLSVLSQLINVGFYRVWGRFADRFSNKSVLGVAGFLFIISIFAWPFLTLPEQYIFTLPLLILIHVLAGISTAGVNLCSGNIALKAAPKGRATSFLAANAIVNGLAATIAPILAGILADFFSNERLSFSIRWSSISPELMRFQIPALDLQGLDFLFVLAGLFGLYALHRLSTVLEEGEVEEDIVISELYSEARKALRNVSTVAGLRHLTYFPYDKLVDLLRRPRTDGPQGQ